VIKKFYAFILAIKKRLQAGRGPNDTQTPNSFIVMC